MNGPCKECKKRHPNCHSTCEEYMQWKRAYWKVRREERVERDIGYSIWLNKYKRRKVDGKK